MGRESYISQNPHFVTSALSRFTPRHFLSIVEGHGIRYQEREEGRLFCNESSRQIVDMLRSECDRAAVRLQLNCRISEISKTDGFRIATDKGVFDSESLVIATGGLSYPNLGASNFGYTVAKQFGLKVTKLNPALTPLRFSPEDAAVCGALAGISIDSTVSYAGAKFRGTCLFTHNGISGPAILQISSYWDRKCSLTVDLLPELDIFAVFLEKRHSKIASAHYPRPVSAEKIREALVRTLRCIEANQPVLTARNRFHRPQSARMAAARDGTEGFNKAEVTLGGVDTDELSSRSMESKKVPGLYFLGEVIDVTGHLGGYNLHWAWASGVCRRTVRLISLLK